MSESGGHARRVCPPLVGLAIGWVSARLGGLDSGPVFVEPGFELVVRQPTPPGQREDRA